MGQTPGLQFEWFWIWKLWNRGRSKGYYTFRQTLMGIEPSIRIYVDSWIEMVRWELDLWMWMVWRVMSVMWKRVFFNPKITSKTLKIHGKCSKQTMSLRYPQLGRDFAQLLGLLFRFRCRGTLMLAVWGQAMNTWQSIRPHQAIAILASWGSSENTTRQLRLKNWMSHENHILMTKFSKFIARRQKKKRPRAVSRRRERNVTWSWRSCTTTNPMFRPRTTRSGLVAGCCDLCWMILVQGFVVAVHGVFLPLFLHLFLYYI